jgi:hypothetical protein
VPWWWHACTPIFAVLIGGEMVLTDHLVIASSIIGGVFLLAELFLWSLGRSRIVVQDNRVRAGNWRLPIAQVRGFAILSPEQMRAELRRRGGDTYICTVPWISGGLLLDVEDPEDKPLWLISTRHPDALAAALAEESMDSGLPIVSA